MFFDEMFKSIYNFHFCMLRWCKMDLSLATRNEEQILEKSKQKGLFVILP